MTSRSTNRASLAIIAFLLVVMGGHLSAPVAADPAPGARPAPAAQPGTQAPARGDQGAPVTDKKVDPSPGGAGTSLKTTSNEPRVRILLFAFMVGAIGSAAFYFGVWLGFITPTSRDRILVYLERRPQEPSKDPGESQLLFAERLERFRQLAQSQRAPLHSRIVLFFVFGGLVATVFQWAQPDQFIPIQAFVLGATWPSVVTRVMAGGGGGDTDDSRLNLPVGGAGPGSSGPTPQPAPIPAGGAAPAAGQPAAGQTPEKPGEAEILIRGE